MADDIAYTAEEADQASGLASIALMYGLLFELREQEVLSAKQADVVIGEAASYLRELADDRDHRALRVATAIVQGLGPYLGAKPTSH